MQAAYEDVAREVPGYRMNYANAGWHRIPPHYGSIRSHNHLNAVAIDVNAGQNPRDTEPNRRRDPGKRPLSGK